MEFSHPTDPYHYSHSQVHDQTIDQPEFLNNSGVEKEISDNLNLTPQHQSLKQNANITQLAGPLDKID